MNVNAVLEEFVLGKDYRILLKVCKLGSARITKAWLTVKENKSDADNEAVISKIIEAGDPDTPGTGFVVDDGEGGVGIVRFDVTPGDQGDMEAEVEYHYDVQLALLDGVYESTETYEIGTVIPIQPVTIAVA